MRQHSQQSVDREMQQDVSDYRDDDRQQQSMSIFGAGNVNYASKRSVERIRHRHNKLNEAGAAVRRHQGKQKPHSQQRVDHVEDVINDLRNRAAPRPRSTSRSVSTTSLTAFERNSPATC